ncbi:MAG: LuxR family transcriptional regulator [Ignavibacteriales bacterium]|nr:MAG: LuxR family transcriptional regulator [Ignavibacteriales bacterium]
MEHLKIAGVFLTIALGTGIAFYIASLLNRFKDKNLPWLLFYMITYNTANLLFLTKEYIEINLKELLKLPFPVTDVLTDVSTIFWLLWTTSIWAIVLILLDKPYFNRIKKINIYCIIILLIFIIGKSSFAGSDFYNNTLTTISFYLGNLLDIAEIIILIYLIILARREDNNQKRRYMLSFGYIFLARFVIEIFLFYIPYFIFGIKNPYYIQSVIVFCLTIFNALPFIWLRYYFKEYHTNLKKITPQNIDETIILKNNISEREKEIITLILEGKSNKEIEEKLFLSAHTVKNHIYHIYQKLGINSRYQLIKKFS